MSDSRIVFEDVWGSIIDRGSAGFSEIRWYDTTEAMSAEEFKHWLANFAGFVERLRRPGILTDGTNFLMDRNNLSDQWRDANIVPRYNAAGVKKFAFHMPAGMPAIGAPPAKEGSAIYLTAYFGRRKDALNWLAA